MFLEDAESQDNYGVDLTPLIDVIFQLLIFFMLTNTFAAPALEIALPQLNESQEAKESENITVSLSVDGSIEINGKPIHGSIKETLPSLLQEKQSKAVFFRADKQCAYNDVLTLIQELTASGAGQINFVYEKTVDTQ